MSSAKAKREAKKQEKARLAALSVLNEDAHGPDAKNKFALTASAPPVLNLTGKENKKADKKKKDKKGSSGDLSGDLEGLDLNSTSCTSSSTSHDQDAGARTCSGVLVSEKRARDIKIQSFSLNFLGSVLVEDTTIELNYGQRYGLIGRNGCGKSTFLKCLAAREVPIPDHVDVYFLDSEAEPSDLTAVDWVVNFGRKEVEILEAKSEQILAEEGPDSDLLQLIYDRLDALDPNTFEARASSILYGLGFTPKTMKKATSDMSGGWRMRVALAKALFIEPTMLLLDEPTNHLDLEACVWLEEYLAGYSKILIVNSHSQDFLNGVCTNMMVMSQKKLKYWGGNYDVYVQTKTEQDVNQMKLYKKQQEEIKHTKEFIASCGTYSNLIRQGKSRQKQLDKMIEAGLIEKPYTEPVFAFRFENVGTLPPPLVSFRDIAFSYSGKVEDYLYTGVTFGIDSDSRVALVGPNGAGKSTLLKLLVDELAPCAGDVSRRPGLCIGRYHQHSSDQLNLDISPIEHLQSVFPGRYDSLEGWRSAVGTWGLTGSQQLNPIRQLSDGLKVRLCLCEIAMKRPHILLLDEPTNHCDMEMIDSLADAIKRFEGGVVLVSHDFRLLSKVAEQIWVVDGGVNVWNGDIISYKKHLTKNYKKKLAENVAKNLDG